MESIIFVDVDNTEIDSKKTLEKNSICSKSYESNLEKMRYLLSCHGKNRKLFHSRYSSDVYDYNDDEDDDEDDEDEDDNHDDNNNNDDGSDEFSIPNEIIFDKESILFETINNKNNIVNVIDENEQQQEEEEDKEEQLINSKNIINNNNKQMTIINNNLENHHQLLLPTNAEETKIFSKKLSLKLNKPVLVNPYQVENASSNTLNHHQQQQQQQSKNHNYDEWITSLISKGKNNNFTTTTSTMTASTTTTTTSSIATNNNTTNNEEFDVDNDKEGKLLQSGVADEESSIFSLFEYTLTNGSNSAILIKNKHSHQAINNECHLDFYDKFATSENSTTSIDCDTQMQYCTEDMFKTPENNEEELDKKLNCTHNYGQGDSKGGLHEVDSNSFLALVNDMNEKQLTKVQCILRDLMKLRGFLYENDEKNLDVPSTPPMTPDATTATATATDAEAVDVVVENEKNNKSLPSSLESSTTPYSDDNNNQETIKQQIYHLKYEDSLIMSLKHDKDRRVKSIALKNDCEISTQKDEKRKNRYYLIIKGKSERKLKRCLNSLKETFPNTQLKKKVG